MGKLKNYNVGGAGQFHIFLGIAVFVGAGTLDDGAYKLESFCALIFCPFSFFFIYFGLCISFIFLPIQMASVRCKKYKFEKLTSRATLPLHVFCYLFNILEVSTKMT